jgi:1,4-dihydroxy-2-naphthoyl-CoA synthase
VWPGRRTTDEEAIEMTLELPETFRYEKRGRIAVMTINRPRAMNAFTGEMLAAMDACFEDFRKDDELWVAILTGAGEKAFCAGMDLQEAIPRLNAGEELGYSDHTKRPFSDVFKPIIAAVNGFCIAGGMEFMQGTDIRIAAEHATSGSVRSVSGWSRPAARTCACRDRSRGRWRWNCCSPGRTSMRGVPAKSASSIASCPPGN